MIKKKRSTGVEWSRAKQGQRTRQKERQNVIYLHYGLINRLSMNFVTAGIYSILRHVSSSKNKQTNIQPICFCKNESKISLLERTMTSPWNFHQLPHPLRRSSFGVCSRPESLHVARWNHHILQSTQHQHGHRRRDLRYPVFGIPLTEGRRDDREDARFV